MNPCESIQTDLDAFRDGTLDEARCLEIRQHLQQCTVCEAEMKQAQYAEQLISDVAENWTPPDHLWSRIQSSANEQQASTSVSSRIKIPGYGWAIAAMLLLTFSLFDSDMIGKDASQINEPVASVLVNEFHTFVISQRELDYVENQPDAIREWVGSKVDFRAPKPLKTQTMQLEGGRLCNMLNQRIASYMYRSDGAWVSLYIMKPEPAGMATKTLGETVVQGYGYIDWERDGLHYSLVGDIDVNRLRQFANELKSI